MSDMFGIGGMAQAAASNINTMMNIGAQLYAGRRQQTAANAQAAAAMKFERENMFHQNRVAIDMMHDTQDFNSKEAAISREWQGGQAGIARDWNAQQSQLERTFNAEEAAKNRAFQEEMANTAWQRGTRDMQKAGINPMLAFSKGGADSPAGSAASAGAASTSAPGGATASSGGGSPAGLARSAQAQQLNYIGSAISSGIQAASMLAQIDQQKADTRLTEAQADRLDLETAGGAYVDEKTGKTVVVGKGLRQRMETLKSIEAWRQSREESTTAGNVARASEWEPKFAKARAARTVAEAERERAGIAEALGKEEFNKQLNALLPGGKSTAWGVKVFAADRSSPFEEVSHEIRDFQARSSSAAAAALWSSVVGARAVSVQRR